MTRDELFQEFWLNYPRKLSKQDAKRVWAKIPIAELPAVMEGLERARHSDLWRERLKEAPDGRYLPYPATWLRAGGWEDEYHITIPKQEQRPAQIDRCEVSGCTSYAVHSDLAGRHKRCREHVHTKQEVSHVLSSLPGVDAAGGGGGLV